MLVYGFPLKCQWKALWADHGGMSETPNRPFMCKDDGVDKKMRFSQSMPNILGPARRNERDCWLLIYLFSRTEIQRSKDEEVQFSGGPFTEK